MLQALKNGHLSELEKYADIMPLDIKEYLVLHEPKVNLRATIQKKKELQSQKRNEKVNNNLEKLITGLIALGINVEIAEKSSVKAIKSNPTDSMPELMVLALKYSDEIQNKEPKQINKSNTDFVLLKLFEKAKKNKVSNYDVLKEAGYIKLPIDEFVI